jgi:hypothetical protein
MTSKISTHVQHRNRRQRLRANTNTCQHPTHILTPYANARSTVGLSQASTTCSRPPLRLMLSFKLLTATATACSAPRSRAATSPSRPTSPRRPQRLGVPKKTAAQHQACRHCFAFGSRLISHVAFPTTCCAVLPLAISCSVTLPWLRHVCGTYIRQN